MCSLAGSNYSTNELTDPVKEFWEYVYISLDISFFLRKMTIILPYDFI